MTQTPEHIARGLSKAQKTMVIESEPGGFGRNDTACGVPLHGARFRVAASLENKGLGEYSFGSSFEDLYFNNQRGLAVRAILKEQAP